MSARVTSLLAWALCATGVGLALITFVFAVRYPGFAGAEGGGATVAAAMLVFMPAALAFPLVGGLVASRRPSLSLGWLYLAAGVALSLSLGTIVFYWMAEVEGVGAFPLGDFGLAVGNYIFYITFVCALIALMHFPTGSYMSPRWRIVGWLLIVGFGVSVLGNFFHPEELLPGVPNPYALPQALPLLEVLITIGDVLALAGLVAAAVAPLIRLRRSRGVERQQMKWLIFACAIVVAGFALAVLPFPALEDLGWTVGILGLGLVPVATGIAVLRYRLWDIDLIIRRTMVYSILTVLLAGVYFVLVVTAQLLLQDLSGQGSSVAIVPSTLAIAALFMPLRRRVQNSVDQRFYRRKVDAATVLASFARTARDEVDLSRLVEALQRSVQDALEPECFSLWLVPEQRRNTPDQG